ncbi:MAG: GspE/PulE family protein [candidate division KSB1 bacterium]|nr:GspE/PulE family protein [candidate division KSB1 bacterium]
MAKREDRTLIQELLNRNYLKKQDLAKFQDIAAETLASDGITQTLLRYLKLDQQKMAEIISEAFDVPLLTEVNGVNIIDVEGLSKEDFLKRFRTIPIILENNELTVAIVDPPYRGVIELLERQAHKKVVPVVMTVADFQRLYKESIKTSPRSTPVQIDFEKLDVAKRGEQWAANAETSGTLPPANKVLDRLLQTAIETNVSDIHLEAKKDGYVNVRYRLDDVLQRVVTLPKKYTQTLPTMIKQSASSATFDKRGLQEGQNIFSVNGRKIQTRINSILTSYGEKITIRIVTKNLHIYNLEELALNLHDYQQFRQLLAFPNAVILFVGPGGCGKTTTMYAALDDLNMRSMNISTIENPIECEIPGLNQTSSSHLRKNTSTEAIRALFHQDVDILAIGETRDSEEAELLIEAGLTGMSAFTTLQAANAIRALYRLRNLGVRTEEMALVIRGIVAQRFVRKVCPHCQEEYRPDLETLTQAGLSHLRENFAFKHGKGCQYCFGTGYLHRVPLFEILVVDDVLSTVIHNNESYGEIKTVAQKHGFTSMRHDGLRKALAGITTLEEVIRVT